MGYALAISLATNLVLLYYLIHKRRSLRGNSEEYEAYLQLKQDLSNFSGGIIEFRRIDPSSIFYRSVR